MNADLVFWIVQALHGLQYSMLLFLLSVGLTVIFGLLHFVNLAHGVLYALGAYICYSLTKWTGIFWIGFIAAPLGVALIGGMLYSGLIQRMRLSNPMSQVLVTFGLIFIFIDMFRIIWGDIDLGVAPPDLFSAPIEFFGIAYSSYRLFVIGLGLTVLVGLHLILSRTPIGAIIRASVDNDQMAACLGIDVKRLFYGVFCVGCALAGIAGAVAVPMFSATPDMGSSVLIPTLIVVVIGGLGSLQGAIIGSLLIGFIQTMGAVIAPQFSSILIYILLACILLLRPQGLFPVRGR